MILRVPAGDVFGNNAALRRDPTGASAAKKVAVDRGRRQDDGRAGHWAPEAGGTRHLHCRRRRHNRSARLLAERGGRG